LTRWFHLRLLNVPVKTFMQCKITSRRQLNEFPTTNIFQYSCIHEVLNSSKSTASWFIRRGLRDPLNARQLTRSSALCPQCTRARVNPRRNARIVVETRRAITIERVSIFKMRLRRKAQFYRYSIARILREKCIKF